MVASLPCGATRSLFHRNEHYACSTINYKGWFTESNCRLATISSQATSQPTDRSSLTWPDPLRAGAYRFEIISAGMQGCKTKRGQG